jgi:hypothetical protein
MYLIEIKLGDAKIRRYIPNAEMLAQLIEENPQYEYIKIIEEVKDENISKKKVRKK